MINHSNFTSLKAKNSMVLLDEAVFDRVYIFIEIAVLTILLTVHQTIVDPRLNSEGQLLHGALREDFQNCKRIFEN